MDDYLFKNSVRDFVTTGRPLNCKSEPNDNKKMTSKSRGIVMLSKICFILN